MTKIKKLLEELKSEIKKETGVKPNIDINIHQSSSNKTMSLTEANRQFEHLRQKIGLERWILSFKEGYSSITTRPMDDELTIFFNDRRDEIENRQSDTRKRVQEPELPEMAVY